MKNLIAMMNAMKFYDNVDLINTRMGYQQKLSQDLDAVAYQKMVDKIRTNA